MIALTHLARVARLEPGQHEIRSALERGQDLGQLVADAPPAARRLVEELWSEGLALRADGEDGTKPFDQAERLSRIFHERFDDASLAHATAGYRRRQPDEAAALTELHRLLEEATYSYENGSLTESADNAQRALDGCRDLRDGWCELAALQLLGDVAWTEGRPQDAKSFYLDLLSLAIEYHHREREAAAVNNLAAFDEDSGRLREAAAGYRRAVELSEVHGLPYVRAYALLYQGHFFHYLGLYHRSVRFFREAEESFRALGERELVADTAANRGASLQQMGESKEALAAYRLSLALLSREGDWAGRVRTLLHVAELLAATGEQERALAVLREILARTRDADEASSRHFRWGALVTLGDLYLAEGRLGQAGVAYQEAEALATELGRSVDQVVTTARRARFLVASGEIDRAVQELDRAVGVIEALRASPAAEEERVQFLETQRSVYEDLAGIHLRHLKDPATAFALLERGRSRAFLDSLQGGALLSSDEGGRLRVLLHSAAEPETLARVAAHLEPGTLLLHYAVASNWLAVLAIDSSGVRAWAVQDVAVAELRRLSLAFAADASTPTPVTARTSFSAGAPGSLSGILLQPVEHLLSKSRALIIVPDDVLFGLPWPALRWGEDDRYLIETHDLVLEPSASVFVRLNERASPGTRGAALVVANPVGSEKDRGRPLPQAEMEARQLATLMPGSRLLLGNQASESAVRAEAGSYPIVHFATHARVEPREPFASSLRLAASDDALEESRLAPIAPDDGVLTGFEAMEMRLSPGALVTLAACETAGRARPGGEGVVGLARAFFEAGASSVVASLWPVEDRATRELMMRFYGAMASGESTTARALAHAQAEMARGSAGESRRHPSYWAGFVLIGDGR